jgi:amidophosphoribosyltransferase
VFGIWAPGADVAQVTYFGLFALQHRGQEAAGIAVSDGTRIVVYKDVGLVAQVFNEPILSSLRGNIAVGHTRYSTTGASTWDNAQPTLRMVHGPHTCTIALAHNGNLVNTSELAADLAESPVTTSRGGLSETSDTAVVAGLFAAAFVNSLESAALKVLPKLRGAFSFVFMDEHTLYGARDAHAVRPLVLGRLEEGWILASETAALDTVGASVVREIEPGELIAIDERGVRSSQFANPDPKGCLFEYVYLARPDSSIEGRSFYSVRVALGRTLARQHPVDADLVIPVPESGVPAAIGYAWESGIPYASGLFKNPHIGRTFIQPTQTIRQLGVRLKLSALPEVISGQRVIIVDDSMIRGNTQRAIVQMLRDAGAIEVHVRISSPPIIWPCYYGIDMPSKTEFLSNDLDTEGVCKSIGADSLGHVSLEGLIAAAEQPRANFCRACFDGVYPIALTSARP